MKTTTKAYRAEMFVTFDQARDHAATHCREFPGWRVAQETASAFYIVLLPPTRRLPWGLYAAPRAR